MKNRTRETGAVNASIFAIVALVLLVLVFGSFSIWAYMNYMDQKKDVDSKIANAEAKAKLDQSTKDEATFAAREKEPMRQFVGPSDYGALKFDYPKTWSAYQATDVSKGGGVTYEAYLNPVLVPPVGDSTKFALRITIEQKTYDQSVASYQKLITKGDLKSSVYSDGKMTGTKIVGNFNKDIYGTAILLKMRDRTLTLRTDGDVFNDDFAALLKTVSFNQ
jgi:type VI protein secretion system component VasK